MHIYTFCSPTWLNMDCFNITVNNHFDAGLFYSKHFSTSWRFHESGILFLFTVRVKIFAAKFETPALVQPIAARGVGAKLWRGGAEGTRDPATNGRRACEKPTGFIMRSTEKRGTYEVNEKIITYFKIFLCKIWITGWRSFYNLQL